MDKPAGITVQRCSFYRLLTNGKMPCCYDMAGLWDLYLSCVSANYIIGPFKNARQPEFAIRQSMIDVLVDLNNISKIK